MKNDKFLNEDDTESDSHNEKNKNKTITKKWSKTETVHNESATVVTCSMAWQLIPIEMHVSLF